MVQLLSIIIPKALGLISNTTKEKGNKNIGYYVSSSYKSYLCVGGQGVLGVSSLFTPYGI